jgi:molybdate transport system substrate-binding protein
MSLQSLLSRPADYSVSRRASGKRAVSLRLVVAALGALIFSMPVAKAAQDSSVRVLSSNGVKAALEKLQTEGERVAGRPLNIAFGTSASTRQRVLAGESFDVAILTVEMLDELANAGKIVKGSTAKMGTSGIGIGVRAGRAKPDITTADALKHVLMAERSLTYAAEGASRPFIERMFGTLGVAEAMKPKTLLEQGSVRAAERVVKGDADMLITLISEIVPVPGIELAGPLPSEFQNDVSFAAGVGASAGHAEVAAKLIAFLSSSEAAPAFTASGIERR